MEMVMHLAAIGAVLLAAAIVGGLSGSGGSSCPSTARLQPGPLCPTSEVPADKPDP